MIVTDTRFVDGLTDDQVMEVGGALARLASTDGWGIFQELLKAQQFQAMQSGFSEGKEKFDWWNGFVTGVQSSSNIVSVILARAKDLQDRDEKKPARRAAMRRLQGGGGEDVTS